LFLPHPVADIESHANGHLQRVDAGEELSERRDTTALWRLIVFHQQMHVVTGQAVGQRGDVAVFAQMAQ
jgi:hypothetical protein